jgi:hypothetical protein
MFKETIVYSNLSAVDRREGKLLFIKTCNMTTVGLERCTGYRLDLYFLKKLECVFFCL